VDEAVLDELVDEDVAEAFDIHLAAMAEPAEALFELGGASRIQAANIGRIGFLLDFFAAGGAGRGGLDGFGTLRAFFQNGFDDVGDDFAGALDDDGVAEVEVEACDLVDVVERDVGDGDAADEDGLELPDGREIAAFADLPADGFQQGRLLLGFVFVGDEPAGRFAG
jgi:hypothetical protein